MDGLRSNRRETPSPTSLTYIQLRVTKCREDLIERRVDELSMLMTLAGRLVSLKRAKMVDVGNDSWTSSETRAMASIFKRKKGRNEPYTIQYDDKHGKRKLANVFSWCARQPAQITPSQNRQSVFADRA
jgi:hypothetical protein